MISFARKSLLQRLPIYLGVIVWVIICAVAVRRAVDNPSRFGVAICVALLLAPFVLRNIRRLPVYLLAGYAALVPFNDLLNVSSGATITRLLAMVTGGCLVVSMLTLRHMSKPSRLLLILLALTVYAGATVLWAIDPSKAMQAYGAYLSYVLLFVIISFYPFSPQEMKLVLGATLIGAVTQSAYGAYLFWQGQEIAGARLYIGNAAAHSIDPNAFAAGLLLPIAVALVMFLRLGFGMTKLFWLAALVTLFAGFLLSGSRGAVIALAVMAIFLMWRSRYRLATTAVAVLFAIVMLAGPVGQRFMQSDVNNFDGRVEVWKVGIASLHQYWLSGAGIGNFGEAFSQFYLRTPHMWLSWDRVAHSIFIQSVVEYGLVGFALLMTLWYLQFRDLAEVRVDGVIGDVCIALRAGILGLFIAGFSLDLMSYKYTWLAFSLIAMMRSTLLGMGVNVDKPDRESRPEAESQLSPTFARRFPV